MWLKQLILQNDTYHTNAIPLKELFPFTLWHLWNIGNKNYFEIVQQRPSITTILQLTNKYHYLIHHSTHKCKLPMYIKWNPLPSGIIRLNMDGAVSTTKSIAGFGGVTRDTIGNWIMDYARYHPLTNISEIMALLCGLQISLIHNLTPLKIQMDAQEVIIMLQILPYYTYHC